MDFLNGGELFTYLRKEQRFSDDRTKIYAAEMVEALAYLHKQGVIYRDLKPENVLFDFAGHIRITDFGLSKTGLGYKTETHSFCGTPEYLAPEIINGKGHTMQCDWWSLGALLYEMLAGRPPHYHKDRNEMLRSIIHVQVPMKPYFEKPTQQFFSSLLERDPE